MTERDFRRSRDTAEAREALRRVRELGGTINGPAGRVGRTAHETRDSAAATNAAIERIDAALGEGVAITQSTNRDIATARAILDTIARFSQEADTRTAESRRAVDDLATASRGSSPAYRRSRAKPGCWRSTR